MLVLTKPDRERIEEARRSDEFFWLDLMDPSPAEFDAVGAQLGLHPVAMEDTREFGQRPKVDVYEDHILLVFFTARTEDAVERVAEPLEVHVYVSGEFVVTVHRQACDLLERLHATLQAASADTEDYLVYQILDTLTDAYYPVITALEDRIDAIEGEVLQRARREQLTHIYRLRQEVRELQRLVSDQRDHFHGASEAIGGLAGLEMGPREYLRDVGDHLTQISGELQRQNDDLLSLATTYFNANTDRLNAVVTRLTIIGTLFLAWTLVTGFFGQNFGWLVSHIDGRTHFLVYGIGGLLVPTVILMTLFWVKRRDWF